MINRSRFNNIMSSFKPSMAGAILFGTLGAGFSYFSIIEYMKSGKYNSNPNSLYYKLPRIPIAFMTFGLFTHSGLKLLISFADNIDDFSISYMLINLFGTLLGFNHFINRIENMKEEEKTEKELYKKSMEIPLIGSIVAISFCGSVLLLRRII